MTKEEKQKAIDALKISSPIMATTQEEFNDYIQTINQIMDWLEQEPCDEEYIKVPKNALKYRTAGMVAYNADWLKTHFDLERATVLGEQKLNLDKIRSEALVEYINDLDIAAEMCNIFAKIYKNRK